MEPLARTSIIIACDHLAEADLVAVAVPRLALLVFVVALVQRFFVGGYGRLYGDGTLLVRALGGRRVGASRGTGTWLGVLGQGGENGGRSLGGAALGCFGIDRVGGSRVQILAFGARCGRCSRRKLAFEVAAVYIGVAEFIFDGSVPGSGFGL